MPSNSRSCSCRRQLGSLESQADVLNKAVDKLQDKNPRRAQQITRLEEENFDLDDRIQKAGRHQIDPTVFGCGYQEDQKLLLQLREAQSFQNPGPKLHRPKRKIKIDENDL